MKNAFRPLLALGLFLTGCAAQNARTVLDPCPDLPLREFFGEEEPIPESHRESDYSTCSYSFSEPEGSVFVRSYQEHRIGESVVSPQDQYEGSRQTFSEGGNGFKEDNALGKASFSYDTGVITGLVVLKDEFLLEIMVGSEKLTAEERAEAAEKAYLAL